MSIHFERCHLCKEYYIPSNSEMRVRRETDGDWTCPKCLEALAKEEAMPFNMEEDYAF